jgi:hypothetical protein
LLTLYTTPVIYLAMEHVRVRLSGRSKEPMRTAVAQPSGVDSALPEPSLSPAE